MGLANTCTVEVTTVQPQAPGFSPDVVPFDHHHCRPRKLSDTGFSRCRRKALQGLEVLGQIRHLRCRQTERLPGVVGLDHRLQRRCGAVVEIRCMLPQPPQRRGPVLLRSTARCVAGRAARLRFAAASVGGCNRELAAVNRVPLWQVRRLFRWSATPSMSEESMQVPSAFLQRVPPRRISRHAGQRHDMGVRRLH